MRSMLLIWVVWVGLGTPLQAETYFLDSRQGDDRADGTSESEAWKSLEKVNGFRFEPGDTLLLRSGSTWEGQLVPRGSGSSASPIRIGSYGEGNRPRIEGMGEKDTTLLLENVEYWTVEDLEITNRGEAPMGGRRGVIVRALDFGDCRGITLRNLVIRDVNGSLAKSDNGGGGAILIHNGGERIPTRFIDLVIEDCHLLRCERNGINFRGNTRRNAWHPSLGVVIRGNLLEHIPGDGIVPIGCDGALVEYNVMRDCPDTLPWGDAAAGIWPWSSDNTRIQFNEVSGHQAKWDGQGFDSDWNSQGTIIQYNYSHDNAGGFLLVCNKGDTIGTEGNIGTTGTVVRYNVSINDGIREYPTRRRGWFTPIIHISGPVEDTRIYNNLIIVPKKRMEEIDASIVTWNNWGGPWPIDTLIANNIFIAEDSIGFNTGEDVGTVYSNNAYIGNFEALPEDKGAIFEDPKLVDASARGDGFEVLRNFMLRKGSPLINRGMSVGDAEADLFGNPIQPGRPLLIGVHQP